MNDPLTSHFVDHGPHIWSIDWTPCRLWISSDEHSHQNDRNEERAFACASMVEVLPIGRSLRLETGREWAFEVSYEVQVCPCLFESRTQRYIKARKLHAYRRRRTEMCPQNGMETPRQGECSRVKMRDSHVPQSHIRPITDGIGTSALSNAGDDSVWACAAGAEEGTEEGEYWNWQLPNIFLERTSFWTLQIHKQSAPDTHRRRLTSEREIEELG
jgi:hypothetical protein